MANDGRSLAANRKLSTETRALPKYPADHQVGMRVPKGGSDCAKCEHVRNAGTECAQPQFVAWHGSHELPAPADSYCCDFFDARTKPRTARELRREK